MCSKCQRNLNSICLILFLKVLLCICNCEGYVVAKGFQRFSMKLMIIHCFYYCPMMEANYSNQLDGGYRRKATCLVSTFEEHRHPLQQPIPFWMHPWLSHCPGLPGLDSSFFLTLPPPGPLLLFLICYSALAWIDIIFPTNIYFLTGNWDLTTQGWKPHLKCQAENPGEPSNRRERLATPSPVSPPWHQQATFPFSPPTPRSK